MFTIIKGPLIPFKGFKYLRSKTSFVDVSIQCESHSRKSISTCRNMIENDLECSMEFSHYSNISTLLVDSQRQFLLESTGLLTLIILIPIIDILLKFLFLISSKNHGIPYWRLFPYLSFPHSGATLCQVNFVFTFLSMW